MKAVRTALARFSLLKRRQRPAKNGSSAKNYSRALASQQCPLFLYA